MHPMKYFLDLAEITSEDISRVGRKAYNLAFLFQRNFPIPSGFCLPAEVYAQMWENYLSLSDFCFLPSSRQKEKLEELQSFIYNWPFDDALVGEVDEILKASGGKVIVRSSSIDEDGVRFSFAGIFCSISLLTEIQEVVFAIRSVWASLWTPQAFLYRQERNIPHNSARMSVIVQRQIEVVSSGVLFTRHPVTGKDELVINTGGAENVVSGRNLPQELLIKVDREKREIEKVKRSGDTSSFVLDNAAIKKLAKYACEMEELFRYPLDIEWVSGEELFIVQSRPLCGSSRWTREPISDFVPVKLTPLSAEFVRMYLEERYLNLYRELGVELPQEIPLTTDYRGRVYVNQDVMMMIKKRLEDGENLGIHIEKAMDMLVQLPAKTCTYSQELQKINTKTCLEVVSPLNIFIALIDCMCRNDSVIAITYLWGLLLDYYKLLLPPELSHYGDYFSSISSTDQDAETYAFSRDLEDLAERLDSDASFADYIMDRDSGEIPVFLRSFIEKYGHWAESPLELACPRYRENHDFLKKMLINLGNRENREVWKSANNERRKRCLEIENVVSKIKEEYARCSGRVEYFNELIRWILYLIDERERHRRYNLAATELLRKKAIEMARYLVRKGFLDNEDSIFYLYLHEIKILQSLEKYQDSWRDYIRERIEEYWKPDVFPEEFVGVIPKALSDAVGEVREGRRLEGISLNSGTVTARARVISDLSDIKDFERGEIVVVSTAEPFWSVLFPLATGFISETGGLLSHAAILSREYNIPAISGIPYATCIIKTGDRITLNADQGWIMIEAVAHD